jgi:pimeloyl-ACP methyl ester carboxylesterase
MQGDEADATYKSLWQARMTASPAVAQAFSGTSLPLGKSSDDWLSVIRLLMEFGEISEAGTVDDPLGNLLTLATSTAAADQQKASTAFADLDQSAADTLATPGADDFYAYIACQEIWSDLTEPKLASGVMTATPTNVCAEAGLTLGPETYDAAKWPIKAPIYYFDGQNDPATPIALAHYHFKVETTSPKRQMTVVAGGGHNPLELSLTPCLHTVWQAIGDDTPLATALETCNWSPGVTLITVGSDGGESPQTIAQSGT